MRRWHTVDWLTVVATIAGGAAALLGTVIAHALGSREERKRASGTERRDSYIAYLVALDAGFGTLRALADPTVTPADRERGIQQAMGDAGVYRTRERLLLAGNPSVISPAEAVLRRLAAVRDVIRAGHVRRTREYHDVYHLYSEALWNLRGAIRKDLGAAALTPANVEKETWDSKATCPFCQQLAAGSIPAQAQPI